MARPRLLTPELLEKAKGYLATCEDSYRKANQPIFEDAMGNEIDIPDEEEETADGPDPLYKDAKDAVRAAGNASTSYLQRTLRIGYSRASHLMDLLEEHKVVGEADGSKPRALMPEEEELPYEIDEDEEFGGMKAPEPIRRVTSRRTLWEGRTRLRVNLPSVAGLAVYLGVARQTVRDWANQGEQEDAEDLYVEFSTIVETVLAEQELRLSSKGVSGEYNSVISKLLLTKHGYSDKQDITSGGERIAPTAEQQARANAAVDAFLKGMPQTDNGDTDTTPGNTGHPSA